MRHLRYLLAALVLFCTLPAFAADEHAYAPEDCEFRMEFPGAPFQARRCDPNNPTMCREMTSFTKVFGLDASLSINITCNKAETNMYERYNGDVMQTTLSAMLGRNHLDDYQTGYQEFDEAKQAVLLGTGQAGNSEKIFVAQLWIGHKSVLTVEAELIGSETTKESDTMFSDMLHSIRHEAWPKPGDSAESVAESARSDDAAPQGSKAEKTP